MKRSFFASWFTIEPMSDPRPQDSRELRRAEQVQAARSSILNAAARVFLRDGYHRSTMRGIAKEAGYTASSLYTYFPSKEAMFDELRESITRRGLEVFEKPMPHGLSFRQKLEMVSLRLEEFAFDMREALLLVVVGGAQLPDENLATRVHHSREFMVRVTAWFDAQMDSPELRKHSPEDVAYVFYGMVEAMLNQALDMDGPVTNARLQDAFQKAREFTLAALGQTAQLVPREQAQNSRSDPTDAVQSSS